MAQAADLELNVTAAYSKLPFSPSSFGSTEARLPVEVVMTVDDTQIETYPAGTEFQSGFSLTNTTTALQDEYFTHVGDAGCGGVGLKATWHQDDIEDAVDTAATHCVGGLSESVQGERYEKN